MDLIVRPVADDEYRAYGQVVATAFGVDYDEERQAEERKMIPLEQTLGAFAGDRLVGTEGVLRMTLSVPGARVPMAGITTVGVLPTHRRRGVLTAVMRHRLDRLHQEGAWLAGLWAAESPIYGRFGYGTATERIGFEVDTSRSAFAPPLKPGGTIRLVDTDEALRVLPPIFDRACAHRPGMLGRDDEWWRQIWLDPKDERDGGTALRCAVHSDGEVDNGYAMYRTKMDWGLGALSQLTVEELVTISDAAYADLWRFLFDVDLMPRLVAYRRPVDEALPWMLADRAAIRRRTDEGLWLRLVEVAPALEARAYGSDGDLVFEVSDSFCPWNQGRYQLTVSGGRGECRASSKPPQLRLGVADLAAGYLAGLSFSTLVAAGRVEEVADHAAMYADRIFGWHRPPWCDRIF